MDNHKGDRATTNRRGTSIARMDPIVSIWAGSRSFVQSNVKIMFRQLLDFLPSNQRPMRRAKTNQENPFVRQHHLRDLEGALGNSVGKCYETLCRCRSEACRKKHLRG